MTPSECFQGVKGLFLNRTFTIVVSTGFDIDIVYCLSISFLPRTSYHLVYIPVEFLVMNLELYYIL